MGSLPSMLEIAALQMGCPSAIWQCQSAMMVVQLLLRTHPIQPCLLVRLAMAPQSESLPMQWVWKSEAFQASHSIRRKVCEMRMVLHPRTKAGIHHHCALCHGWEGVLLPGRHSVPHFRACTRIHLEESAALYPWLCQGSYWFAHMETWLWIFRGWRDYFC